ncbi:coatomer subunit zeta-1-like isoform X1 [Macrobrachium nipponense]|uniref:coatomer subunit zeta-1-like isoform X1 n=1 Tax=Macrobrachium nipponense TaxID=159736 RepID=UPI0030C7EA73
MRIGMQVDADATASTQLSLSLSFASDKLTAVSSANVNMSGLLEPTLYVIKGIAILDNDGNRLLAKYYDPTVFPTVKDEKKFEKNLFQKTHRANAEVIMLDRLTCVYRSNVDLFFYVMGLSHENELILVSVLSCLYDAVSSILRKNVEKRTLLDNLDIIMLAMDEICDGGVPLETDPQVVSQRVALRMEESPFNDQTVTQKHSQSHSSSGLPHNRLFPTTPVHQRFFDLQK